MRNRRRFGKKFSKIFNRNRSATTAITRSPSGFTDRFYTRLKYAEVFQVDLNIASTQLVFRGNGAFDPEVAVGGHSPLYWTAFAGIYNRYGCFGSKIQLDVLNKSGASGVTVIVAPSTDDLITTTTSTLLEQPRAKIMRIIPVASRFSHRMKMYASTRQQLGIPKANLFDDIVTANTANTPISQWFWNLFIEASDSVSELSLSITIQIVYYLCFYDRIEQGTSELPPGIDGPEEELLPPAGVDPTP